MNTYLTTLMMIYILGFSLQSMGMSSSSSGMKRPSHDSQSQSLESSDENKTKKIMRSILLRSTRAAQIEHGKITSEGFVLDIDGKDHLSNETFETIISNQNGACLAYNPMTRQVCDATDEKYDEGFTTAFHSAHSLFLRAQPSGDFHLVGSYEEDRIKLIRKALAGDSDSQNDLGCYLDCPELEDEALAWFKKSAQQNNHWGIYNVGLHAYNRKNYNDAIFHLITAHELGNKDACLILAEMYKNGLGVDSDIEKAQEYKKMFLKKVEDEIEENEKAKK